MKNPQDGYWMLGNLVLGQWKWINSIVLAEHFRGWIIKAFFLPLMFTYLMGNIAFLSNYNLTNIGNSFKTFYDFSYSFIFTIDVALAAVGYVMTMRILDSHIRSAEPTFVGWFVALMCYSPFWHLVFSTMYINYENTQYWGDMTAQHPILYTIWGSTILILILIYSLATVSFGYRFSNLTYRGLITNGPYRWSKHPAYIFKNISWWFISVPFFSAGDATEALRLSLLLLLLNFVYYLRARTEENHLSNYPEYVEYANWIEKHGLLRWVGKLIPYLRYDETRTKSRNTRTWWQQDGRTEYE
jgi:isoprenylcysteine carboxyl methyltransferase (ICMT) family protein YpbQ